MDKPKTNGSHALRSEDKQQRVEVDKEPRRLRLRSGEFQIEIPAGQVSILRALIEITTKTTKGKKKLLLLGPDNLMRIGDFLRTSSTSGATGQKLPD